MIKTITISVLIFIINFNLLAYSKQKNVIQKDEETKTDYVFNSNEKLEYIVHWGFLNMAKASIEIKTKKYNGIESFFAIAIAKTIGSFYSMYKVKDIYASYFSKKTLLPYKAVRNIRESSYKTYNVVSFNRADNTVNSFKSGVKKVPKGIMDFVSASYYLRQYKLNNLKKDQIITIQTYFDDEVFPLKVKFKGYKTIKTKFGKIKCIKMHPVMKTGDYFKTEEDLTIYITADKNKIPIKLELDIFLGTLKVDLIKHTNLKYKLGK